MAADEDMGLAGAIEGLRAALNAAVEEGRGQGMQFQVGPIDLSLEVLAHREGKGKVGWKVVEAGGAVGSSRTQKLTMRLTPVWRAPDGTLITDFTVASPLAPDDNFGTDE